MRISHFQSAIAKKGAVYVKDSFYDVAIRAELIDGVLKTFLKHKSSKEVEVPQDYDTFCQVLFGGNEITKKEYDKY